MQIPPFLFCLKFYIRKSNSHVLVLCYNFLRPSAVIEARKCVYIKGICKLVFPDTLRSLDYLPRNEMIMFLLLSTHCPHIIAEDAINRDILFNVSTATSTTTVYYRWLTPETIIITHPPGGRSYAHTLLAFPPPLPAKQRI